MRSPFYFSGASACMHVRSLRIQTLDSHCAATSCLTATSLEPDPAPSPADPRCRHQSQDMACAVPAAREPATRRARGPAIPAAAAARRAPVQVAESRAADFPAAPLVAVRSDFPASQAGFLAVRSASRSRPCDSRYRARYCRWPCYRSIAVGAITARVGRCSREDGSRTRLCAILELRLERVIAPDQPSTIFSFSL
jgi:hypothetical protein